MKFVFIALWTLVVWEVSSHRTGSRLATQVIQAKNACELKQDVEEGLEHCADRLDTCVVYLAHYKDSLKAANTLLIADKDEYTRVTVANAKGGQHGNKMEQGRDKGSQYGQGGD